MRVLLVCHGYPPQGVAGVERLSAQTAEELTRRGHEVTVLTRRASAGPSTLMLERQSHAGVPVVAIAGGGPRIDRFPAHEPALEGIFERMLAEVAPDVVLATHLLHHSPGYVAIAHRMGIPFMLELHDFFALCPRIHLQRTSGELCDGPEAGSACARHCFEEQREAQLRWAMRSQSFAEAVQCADGVLAPSRYVAEKFADLRGGGSPIQVVENAVADLGPVLRSEPDPSAPLHLASIGVTVKHKGFQVVVKALRGAALGPTRYTIFGVALQPGALKLHEAANEVPNLDFRLFNGFSPTHLPALLADVDALVVPSLVPETYSIVAREAFACGVPVIASKIGALPDAIRPDDNGWLFTSDDSSELAALLQRLDGDRRLLRRAAAGIRSDDVTSVAARTGNVEELLREAVERRGRRRQAQGRELMLIREALLTADAAGWSGLA